MTDTAEIRWFARGTLPDAVTAWFDALGPSTEPEVRTDRYRVPASAAVGEKRREGSAERKTRTAVGGALGLPAADGAIEHWRKESVESLTEGATVDVAKRRRLHRAETLDGVCTLELGSVQVDGARWWTVCLEVNGESADGRTRALRASARRWLGRPDAPDLPAEAARGYPAWLMEQAG